MNFDEAITAHSQWKVRLKTILAGASQETLDPAMVALDNRCPLGQWIYSDATVHAALSEYDELKREHAQFHRCAAEVLTNHIKGDASKAKLSLDQGGAFHEASLRTINAIRHLRRRVEK